MKGPCRLPCVHSHSPSVCLQSERLPLITHVAGRKAPSIHQIQFTGKKKDNLRNILRGTFYFVHNQIDGEHFTSEATKTSSKLLANVQARWELHYQISTDSNSVFCSLHCILPVLKPRLLGNKSFFGLMHFPCQSALSKLKKHRYTFFHTNLSVHNLTPCLKHWFNQVLFSSSSSFLPSFLLFLSLLLYLPFLLLFCTPFLGIILPKLTVLFRFISCAIPTNVTSLCILHWHLI